MSGAVGIEIVVCIAVGYLGGNYLDERFGTTPWITLFGLTAGVGAAIKGLMRVIRVYKKDLQKAEPQQATQATKQDPKQEPPS